MRAPLLTRRKSVAHSDGLLIATPIRAITAASRFRQISREEEGSGGGDPTRQRAAGRTKRIERAIPLPGNQLLHPHFEQYKSTLNVPYNLGKNQLQYQLP